jgi:magnesium transporter
MALSIIGYDPAESWSNTAATVDELLKNKKNAGVSWISIDGPGNSEAINRLAEIYQIHPLTVEDILNTEQRPKVEEFDHYLFICLKEIRETGGKIKLDQVSFVIKDDTVISFRLGETDSGRDVFDGMRKRILGAANRVRRMGTDYLTYGLMDSVVDEYFSTLEYLGSSIEDFEDRAVDDSDSKFISDIQKVRQQLLRVRRATWPLRDSLSLILRLDNPLIRDELDPFFKDLHENVIQAVETLELYRDLVSGVMEVNLSSVSNRMNKVMKVLTIISTVFIPLTFIVGVYGMNFSFMPELHYRYAYPLTWGVMLLIAGGMLVYFKRKDWF